MYQTYMCLFHIISLTLCVKKQLLEVTAPGKKQYGIRLLVKPQHVIVF